MASPTRSLQHTASGARRPGGPWQLAGRPVSRVGFGAMQLERLAGDRKTAVALLRRTVELGIDHIDTAQFYGHGFVNDVIREAIRAEDDVMVVSKVGAAPDPDGPFLCASRSVPSSCAQVSRTTWPPSDSNRSRSSICAVRTTGPACAPKATRSSTSTTSSP